MTPKEKQLAEISELRNAIRITKSPYAKRDFEKAIKRKEKELREYTKWTKG